MAEREGPAASSHGRRRSSRFCSASPPRLTRRSISKRSTTSRLRTMDELFEFHHAIILLHETGGGTLRVVASRGYENQAIGGRVRVGVGAVGIVAERRKILQLDNLGQQRAYAAAQRRQMMQSGRGLEIGDPVPVPGLPNAESQIAIPLLIRDELVGVFSIESPVRQAFDEHDRSLVTIVANQIASAIRNAQLTTSDGAPPRRCRQPMRRSKRASRNGPRRSNASCASPRISCVMRAAVWTARSIGESAAVRALRDAVAREARRTEPLLLSALPGPARKRSPTPARAARAAKARSSSSAVPSSRRSTGKRRAARTREHEPLIRHAGEQTRARLRRDALSRSRSRASPGASARASGASSSVRNARAPAAATLLMLESSRRRRGRCRAAGLIAARLATWGIAVPALNDRREDIPALVDHFVGGTPGSSARRSTACPPESMRRLEAYAWPGNIRELDTVLERADPGGARARCSKLTKSCSTIDLRSAATD